MTAHWGIEDPAVVEGTDIEKERGVYAGQHEGVPHADNASEFAAETCFAPGHAVSSCGLHAPGRIVMQSRVGVNPLLHPAASVTSL
jgi:hypothetical protein